MGLAETLLAWRDFYAVVAGASATLVGLVFVGVSIQVGRQPLETRMQLLGTMAVVNLLHRSGCRWRCSSPPPRSSQRSRLLFLATFGFVVNIGIDRAQARLPRNETRVVVAYRFVVPLVAEAILAVGAVAMITAPDPGSPHLQRTWC